MFQHDDECVPFPKSALELNKDTAMVAMDSAQCVEAGPARWYGPDMRRARECIPLSARAPAMAPEMVAMPPK